MKKVVRVQGAPSDVRRAKYKELGIHVHQSLLWDHSSNALNLI